ncbi:MAG: DNA-directed RNA polymerase subunit P [Nanoarchaeota archaeon]
MKYACKNCNFRFEKDINVEVIKCPYCNRYEAFRERSAEELLEEED